MKQANLSPFTGMVFLVGAFSAAPVAAGVEFQIETTDHEQSPPKSESTQAAVEGHYLKMVFGSSSGGGSRDVMIFRPDRGQKGTLYVKQSDGSVFAVDGASGGPAFGDQMPPGMSDAQRKIIADAMKQAEHAMKRAGITGRMPGALSAGQRQRVGIARTIVHNPQLVLADEPFAKGFEVFDADEFRGYVVWAVPPAKFTGGNELAAAFKALGEFLKLPAIPAQMRDGLFIFDLSAFGGLLPIGVDKYSRAGGLIETSRFRNPRKQKVALSQFDVR